MTNSFDAELLVIDIDGTLVGRQRTVAPRDVAALELASARGIKIALCTGRVVNACAAIFRQLELDGYHIFFDGAMVSDSRLRHQVYVAHLERAVVREAVDYAREADIFFELFTADGYFVESENEFSDIRGQFFGVEPQVTDFKRLAAEKPIIKGGLVVNNTAEDDRARDFMARFAGRLEFSRGATPFFPDIEFINIVAPGVSKGRALEVLAEQLKVPLERVMAFGDHYNDIPLLETAGLGVAMGNAPEEVKRAAGYITGDVDHCGVAAALQKLVFGK